MELDNIGKDDMYIVDGSFNVHVVIRQGEYTIVSPKQSTTYMYIAKTEPPFTFRLSEEEKSVVDEKEMMPYMKYDTPQIVDGVFMEHSDGHRYLLVKNMTTLRKLIKKRDNRLKGIRRTYEKSVLNIEKLIAKTKKKLDKKVERMKRGK